MRLPGWVPAAGLVIAALASGIALWFLYRGEEPVALTGPPRSDYFLVDFELVSLNQEGKEAFRVSGPLLSRHPSLGTITIEQPDFRFPTQGAEPWSARADRAWATASGSELRLDGNVALDAPSDGTHEALAFRTDSLDVFPRERRAQSEDTVVFSSPHSILQGRAFRIDMGTRRYQFLNEVIGHYETPLSVSPH